MPEQELPTIDPILRVWMSTLDNFQYNSELTIIRASLDFGALPPRATAELINEVDGTIVMISIQRSSR